MISLSRPRLISLLGLLELSVSDDEHPSNLKSVTHRHSRHLLHDEDALHPWDDIKSEDASIQDDDPPTSMTFA